MQPRPSIRPYMQFLFVQSGFPLELPFPRFVTSPQLFFRSGIPHHRGSARTFTAVRISRRSYTSEQPRRNPRLQDGFLCVISHCRKAQGCGGKDSVERGNGYKAFLLWLSGLHARLANIPCLKKSKRVVAWYNTSKCIYFLSCCRQFKSNTVGLISSCKIIKIFVYNQ